MARQRTSCARGASSREHCRIFRRRSSSRSLESRKGWRGSNQDGRMESSLVCLTGVTSSTWAQRGMHQVRTVRRREATERVDLTFPNSVSAGPWDGPEKVRDVRIVLPDVSSPAAMAVAEAIGKGRSLYISKTDLVEAYECRRNVKKTQRRRCWS